MLSQGDTTHHTFLCRFLGQVVAALCAIRDYEDVVAAHVYGTSLR